MTAGQPAYWLLCTMAYASTLIALMATPVDALGTRAQCSGSIHRGISRRKANEVINAPTFGISSLSSGSVAITTLNGLSAPAVDQEIKPSDITENEPFSLPSLTLSGGEGKMTILSTMHSFSVTIVQIPVATICPGSESALHSSKLSLPSTFSTHQSNASVLPSTVMYNGTTPLASGRSTTFSESSNIPSRLSTGLAQSTLPVDLDAVYPNITVSNNTYNTTIKMIDVARIILDDDGCQTIYSPKVTAICNKTMKLAGLPPITITECSQRVTFSTAKSDLVACSGTSGVLASPSSNPSRDALSADLVDDDTRNTTNFVAYWHDLAYNDIPSTVMVENCGSGQNGAECDSHTESWSVTNITKNTTGLGIASFVGPAIVRSGNVTMLTTISINTTLTTTGETSFPTILRKKLTAAIANDTTTVSTSTTTTTSSESIITVVSSEPTTITFSLEKVTSTLISRITVTTYVYPHTSIVDSLVDSTVTSLTQMDAIKILPLASTTKIVIKTDAGIALRGQGI